MRRHTLMATTALLAFAALGGVTSQMGDSASAGKSDQADIATAIVSKNASQLQQKSVEPQKNASGNSGRTAIILKRKVKVAP